MNKNNLLNAKRLEVTIVDRNLATADMLKEFMLRHRLTDTMIANIFGESKETVRMWKNGTYNINGGNALALILLYNHPELVPEVYGVKVIKED